MHVMDSFQQTVQNVGLLFDAILRVACYTGMIISIPIAWYYDYARNKKVD